MDDYDWERFTWFPPKISIDANKKVYVDKEIGLDYSPEGRSLINVKEIEIYCDFNKKCQKKERIVQRNCLGTEVNDGILVGVYCNR